MNVEANDSVTDSISSTESSTGTRTHKGLLAHLPTTGRRKFIVFKMNDTNAGHVPSSSSSSSSSTTNNNNNKKRKTRTVITIDDDEDDKPLVTLPQPSPPPSLSPPTRQPPIFLLSETPELCAADFKSHRPFHPMSWWLDWKYTEPKLKLPTPNAKHALSMLHFPVVLLHVGAFLTVREVVSFATMCMTLFRPNPIKHIMIRNTTFEDADTVHTGWRTRTQMHSELRGRNPFVVMNPNYMIRCEPTRQPSGRSTVVPIIMKRMMVAGTYGDELRIRMCQESGLPYVKYPCGMHMATANIHRTPGTSSSILIKPYACMTIPNINQVVLQSVQRRQLTPIHTLILDSVCNNNSEGLGRWIARQDRIRKNGQKHQLLTNVNYLVSTNHHIIPIVTDYKKPAHPDTDTIGNTSVANLTYNYCIFTQVLKQSVSKLTHLELYHQHCFLPNFKHDIIRLLAPHLPYLQCLGLYYSINSGTSDKYDEGNDMFFEYETLCELALNVRHLFLLTRRILHGFHPQTFRPFAIINEYIESHADASYTPPVVHIFSHEQAYQDQALWFTPSYDYIPSLRTDGRAVDLTEAVCCRNLCIWREIPDFTIASHSRNPLPNYNRYILPDDLPRATRCISSPKYYGVELIDEVSTTSHNLGKKRMDKCELRFRGDRNAVDTVHLPLLKSNEIHKGVNNQGHRTTPCIEKWYFHVKYILHSCSISIPGQHFQVHNLRNSCPYFSSTATRCCDKF